MRNEIRAYQWICDDCKKEVFSFSIKYPEGWDEVDDNSEGKCQDVCEECVKNHSII